MNYNYFYLSITLIIILAIFSGCARSIDRTTRSEQSDFKQQTYAITNVNVIPMTLDNGILENITVIVKDKKIVSLNGAIPENAERIDGKGKWLIPGLIDMHVHNMADIDFSSSYPTIRC